MRIGKYSGYRVFMPYCVKRLEDGRYIVLNRDYMPLGIPSAEKLNLAAHPTAHRIKITPSIAKALSWEGKEDLELIYLHGGGSAPKDGAALAGYSRRLAVLMSLEVEVQPTHTAASDAGS